LKIRLACDLGRKLGLAISGQPANDLIDLGPGASLLFRLGDIERVDAGEAGRENPVAGHDVGVRATGRNPSIVLDGHESGRVGSGAPAWRSLKPAFPAEIGVAAVRERLGRRAGEAGSDGDAGLEAEAT